MGIAEKTRLLACIRTGIAVHILRNESASKGREGSNCWWRRVHNEELREVWPTLEKLN